MSGLIQKAPTLEVFEHVARLYSEGWPLYRISEGFEFVPSPMVLHRWRREFPVFGALMDDAAAVRAERLVEETLAIADDETRSAAHARNAIGVRERMADRIAGRPAPGSTNTGSGVDDVDSIEDATTEQLFALLNARLPVIEGQAQRLTNKTSGVGEGGTPPQREAAPVSTREPDPPPPAINSGETSVTGNETYEDCVDEDAANLAPAGDGGSQGGGSAEREQGIDWIDELCG